MAKTHDIPKPTAAELDLLQALWPLGAATAKQVHEAMALAKPAITYGTVLRLMQIMHTKGLLIRDASQRSHVYAPAQAQDSLQTNLLRDLIHKAFSGSGKDLVMAALRSHVSDEERAQIHAEIQRSLREDEQKDGYGDDQA